MTGGRSRGDPLRGDEILTHCGKLLATGEYSFRNTLRQHMTPPEKDMSLLRGRFSPHAAHLKAYGTRHHRCRGEAARYATVDALRKAGFRVEDTSTVKSPHHVSVYWDDFWGEDVGRKFANCFSEPVSREPEEG